MNLSHSFFFEEFVYQVTTYLHIQYDCKKEREKKVVVHCEATYFASSAAVSVSVHFTHTSLVIYLSNL